MAKRGFKARNGDSQSSQAGIGSAETGPGSPESDASVVDRLANGTYGTEEISFGRRSDGNGTEGTKSIDSGVSGDSDGIKIGTAANPDDHVTAETPKRRGRPPGSKSGAKAGSGSDAPYKGMGIAKAKELIALGLTPPAMATKSPIFLWNEQQVNLVAERVNVVSKWYNLETVTDGKKTAIPFLLGAIGFVFIQQIMLLQMMKQMAKPQPAAQAATTSEAGVNAGMSANGSVDLTGENLKGIHVP